MNAELIVNLRAYSGMVVDIELKHNLLQRCGRTFAVNALGSSDICVLNPAADGGGEIRQAGLTVAADRCFVKILTLSLSQFAFLRVHWRFKLLSSCAFHLSLKALSSR